MMPPAVCSAGIVTPSSSSNGCPNSVNTSRIALAMSVARTAIAARSRRGILGVSVANSTAASTGPMVAKKVVKALSAVSIMGS